MIASLTTRQSRREPHHVIHLKQTPPSEWRTSQPYGDHTGWELRSASTRHQDVTTTLSPP